jgi:hypothetical protein
VVFTEIDKRILKINPVLVGSGIPLFDGVAGTRRDELGRAQDLYERIRVGGLRLLSAEPRHECGVTHSVVVTDRRREKLSITSPAIPWPGQSFSFGTSPTEDSPPVPRIRV